MKGDLVLGVTLQSKSLFWEGFRASLPLMVGVAPFGVVFGALAINAGLSPIQAFGMSVLVLAGSSQFVAAGLIGDNTPILLIVFTTFIINLRHFLYSASINAFLRPLPTASKLVIGYFMVDEVYATAWTRYQTGDLTPQGFRAYFLGAGVSLVTVWWLTTCIGAALGDVLPENVTTALGFTLPLIFTSIVVSLAVTRPALLAAISAGAAGIIFAPIPNKLGLLVASAIGIAVGAMMEYALTHEVTES